MPDPTKAAMRAALAIARMVGDTLKESLESQGYVVTEITLSDPSPVAELIDCEVGLPELIEALEKCINLFEGWRGGIFSQAGVSWIDEPPAISTARTVLRNARGEGKNMAKKPNPEGPLIELLQELVSAVGEYRYWFDTYTRTLEEDWEDLAAGASDRLDSAISAARKRGTKACGEGKEWPRNLI